MKIWLISDLHAERGTTPLEAMLPPIPDADVCVVPGDMDIGDRALEALASTVAPRMPVIYVPGNHCYRGLDQEAVRSTMRRIASAHPGIHLLDPGAVEIEGVRFVGATLWTDFAVGGQNTVAAAMDVARGRFSGTCRVPAGERLAEWTPELARRRHADELAFLADALGRPFEGRTVVVTHHAPHKCSIHPRYRDAGLPYSGAYASDLEHFILQHAPQLWLHGHVHDTVDHWVGATRIVANPKGYQVRSTVEKGVETVHYSAGVVVRKALGQAPNRYEGPENRSFDPHMVIDMERSKAASASSDGIAAARSAIAMRSC